MTNLIQTANAEGRGQHPKVAKQIHLTRAARAHEGEHGAPDEPREEERHEQARPVAEDPKERKRKCHRAEAADQEVSGGACQRFQVEAFGGPHGARPYIRLRPLNLLHPRKN